MSLILRLHSVNYIMISRFMLNLRSIHSTPEHEGDATYTQGNPDFMQTNLFGDLAATVDFPFRASSVAVSMAESSGESSDSTQDEHVPASRWTSHPTPCVQPFFHPVVLVLNKGLVGMMSRNGTGRTTSRPRMLRAGRPKCSVAETETRLERCLTCIRLVRVVRPAEYWRTYTAST